MGQIFFFGLLLGFAVSNYLQAYFLHLALDFNSYNLTTAEPQNSNLLWASYPYCVFTVRPSDTPENFKASFGPTFSLNSSMMYPFNFPY